MDKASYGVAFRLKTYGRIDGHILARFMEAVAQDREKITDLAYLTSAPLLRTPHVVGNMEELFKESF